MNIAFLDASTVKPDDIDLSPVIRNSGRLIITPHTAWATQEARQRLVDGLADNLQAFLDGELRSQVN